MAANTDTPVSDESEQLSRKERIERRQREISETITHFEENAPNEQVAQLTDLLRGMDAELKRLEARNRQLTTRLKRLEAVNGLSGDELEMSEMSSLDHRDKKVVKAIVADGLTKVTLSDFQDLYRGHTDIRDKETLRDRIQGLTRRGPFEHVRSGMNTSVWRFTGSTDA